jgi:hypothetical protein
MSDSNEKNKKQTVPYGEPVKNTSFFMPLGIPDFDLKNLEELKKIVGIPNFDLKNLEELKKIDGVQDEFSMLKKRPHIARSPGGNGRLGFTVETNYRSEEFSFYGAEMYTALILNGVPYEIEKNSNASEQQIALGKSLTLIKEKLDQDYTRTKDLQEHEANLEKARVFIFENGPAIVAVSPGAEENFFALKVLIEAEKKVAENPELLHQYPVAKL